MTQMIIEPVRQNPTWAIQPPVKETVILAKNNVFGRDVVIQEEGTLATVKKDVFGRSIETATAFASPINFETDALAKKLSDKFKFVAGGWTPYTDGQDGGSIGQEGVYGYFDLGNGRAIKPKQDQRFMLDADHPYQGGTIGFLQVSKANQPAPLKADGTMNPDGWQVVSTKSQAMGGIMGTLNVIGAAFGSALFGPAGGLTTDLSGSLDGLMTGSLQTAGQASTTGTTGAFGIIKTVAGNAVSLLNSPGSGLASQLATAAPAVTAAGTSAGTDKAPTLAQLVDEATTTNTAVNDSPAVAKIPDNTGLFMVLITGAALLFFGVIKHG